MAGCLLDEVVNLLSDVCLLSMCELHTSQFVVNPLNYDFSRLIQFLPPRFLTGFTALFDELHELLLFKFTGELTLSVVLIVLFLAMVLLISIQYMLHNLLSGTSASDSHSSTCCNAGWYKLLLLLRWGLLMSLWTRGSLLIVSGLMLLEYFGIEQLK